MVKDVLKLDSYLRKKNCFVCFNESPSKMLKIAFHFILKGLFTFKIMTFLSGIFGHVGKVA